MTCANYPSGGTLPVRHGRHFLSEIKHAESSVGRRGQMTAIILWTLVSEGKIFKVTCAVCSPAAATGQSSDKFGEEGREVPLTD